MALSKYLKNHREQFSQQFQIRQDCNRYVYDLGNSLEAFWSPIYFLSIWAGEIFFPRVPLPLDI